jgi:FkbH-like protein
MASLIEALCKSYYRKAVFVSMVDFWIRNFPEKQQKAIREAIDSGRLAKVRRALALLDEMEAGQRGPKFNVELLCSFNLEPILPVLDLILNSLPSQAQVQLAPLNDIEGYIANNKRSEAKARVVLWRVEELLPEVLLPFSHGFPEKVALRVDEAIERARRIIDLHQRHAPGVPLFLSTVALPMSFSNRVFAAQHSAAGYASIGRFNQSIYELATGRNGVYVVNLCAWAATEGRAYIDTLLDYVARQPLSVHGQMSFALFLARSLRPLIFPSYKALAVDLDNTLWGGIVGEDGVSGLKLGQEFPGNVHLRIQRELLELRQRGVLLVLLSKNNEADARSAFESLQEMLLKWDDFSVRKINWEAKHENLREASRELGLGLDSFAFIDDSDYEREQMRQLLPQVRILNNSGDPLAILRALWETDAFDSYTVSAEDKVRHHDYTVRSARDAGAHKDDLQAFLRSLEMEATIEKVGPANIERVVNMLGKTNQFNLTTKRHSRAEVETLLRQDRCIALALRLRDKFGEQGIVAVLLAAPAKDQRTLAIGSFLVSCRALGRGVEDALWVALVDRARGQNIERFEATYIATARNAIVSGLYDRLGFERMQTNENCISYQLEPLKPVPWPSWITNRDGANEK